MKKLVFIFLIGLMMLPAVASAELKVAVIDRNYLMANVPSGEAMMENLSKEFAGRKGQLEREFKKLEEDRTAYINNMQTMSESQRTTTERELKKRASDFKLKQEAYEEDLKKRRADEAKKLGQKIADAVEAVAKRGGYDILVERGAAPYVGPKVPNVSDQVIQELAK